MTHEEWQGIIDLLRNPAFVLLIAWVLKEVWSGEKKRTSALDLSLKENSQKISELNVSIVRLQTQLESIQRLIDLVPKLKTDIDAAHQKLRDL